MGNLIIKPNTGGELKLQEDGGSDAIAINTSGGVSGAAIKDEDNMSSNSATHLATQQSIKAYVDGAASQATTAAQGLGTGNSPTFTNLTAGTLNTGQGANELYDMDQNVKTDSAVTFASVDVSAGTLTTSTAQKQTISSTAFASGTKMLFNQTSAPTGWTKVTSSNDVALRLTSGTVGTGGTVAFETAFASQTVPLHTLITAEIPAHSHTFSAYNNDAGTLYPTLNSLYTSQPFNTNATGGGGSHGHGAIDLNVSYVDVIIATKD